MGRRRYSNDIEGRRMLQTSAQFNTKTKNIEPLGKSLKISVVAFKVFSDKIANHDLLKLE